MQTVYVGLSGGVDSAVSAALLKERGHNVVGAFIKIWRPEFIECTWKEDRLDAMRGAVALGIPFLEIDLSEEYKKEVVDSMVADYAKGITPNPDVLCNRHIKFGSFFTWARESGADFVATGHYARSTNVRPTRSNMFDLVGRTCGLLRGKDPQKDQSYFLHRLNAEDLAHIMFPMGDMQKSDVRDLAGRRRLPVAKRPDSQGLCFLGDVSIPEFLSRFIKVTPGDVVDMRGAVVGKHDGAALYTIGQRHGFTPYHFLHQKSGKGFTAPLYVVAIDTKANTIRVSPNREDAAVKKVNIRDMHWLQKPTLPLTALAQTRYRETPVEVSVIEENGAYTAHFKAPHIAAPGQSIVLYAGEQCLGGGIVALQ